MQILLLSQCSTLFNLFTISVKPGTEDMTIHSEAGRVFRDHFLSSIPSKNTWKDWSLRISGSHLECAGSQDATTTWEPKGHAFIHNYLIKAKHCARFQELQWTGEIPDFIQLIFLDILLEKQQVNTQDDALSLHWNPRQNVSPSNHCLELHPSLHSSHLSLLHLSTEDRSQSKMIYLWFVCKLPECVPMFTAISPVPRTVSGTE